MACSLVAVAFAAAGMAIAQQPGQARFSTPFPTSFTPTHVAKPAPGGSVRPWNEAQTAPRPHSDGSPAGYRLAAGTRTGASQPPVTPGKVMYFHKPADALVPDGLPESGAVAMAAAVEPPAFAGVPDVTPVPTPAFSPPPARTVVADRPFDNAAVAPPLPFAPTVPDIVPTQPSVPVQTDEKKPDPPAKPPEKDYVPIPPRSAIFTMYDETELEKRIIKSVADRLNKPPEEIAKNSPFPAVAPLVPPGTAYVAKTASLPPGRMVFEPGFVIHRRLHFEEKNAERYGWDLGFIQPFVSTAAFYKSALLWPNSLATGAVTGFWDTNAGKCLPGSPTPYYLYPPGLTITGTVAEAGVITGLAFIIP